MMPLEALAFAPPISTRFDKSDGVPAAHEVLGELLANLAHRVESPHRAAQSKTGAVPWTYWKGMVNGG